MQEANWCNLSYPLPSLVHAGKHRTEAETSPNKHSLYAHNQCPTQASSGGKWYPLVFPCCWLQSLPTNNQNITFFKTDMKGEELPKIQNFNSKHAPICHKVVWQMNTFNMVTILLLDSWLAIYVNKGKAGKMMVIKHLVSNHDIRNMLTYINFKLIYLSVLFNHLISLTTFMGRTNLMKFWRAFVFCVRISCSL